MSRSDAIAVWRGAIVAELAWAGDARPMAIPIVPLEYDGRPCAALPFHRAHEVTSLVDGASASWTVSDPHTAAGGHGVRFTGTVTIEDDLEGDRFVAELLDQELRRHPPSRLRADSPMQRREQWWWLPRRLVLLDRVETTTAFARRTSIEDALLITDHHGGVEVTTVAICSESPPARAGDRVTLASRDGRTVRGAAEPALVMGHDYTVPDLSRWTSWRLRGELRGDVLDVAEVEGAPGASRTPQRLRDRLRSERAIARGCRRGRSHAQHAAG